MVLFAPAGYYRAFSFTETPKMERRGGLKFHRQFVDLVVIVCYEMWLFINLRSCQAAPTKLVPRSEYISLGSPRRATKRLNAAMASLGRQFRYKF